MNVKEVVEKAKSHILDLFGDEAISNVGLEAVEKDVTGYWLVTIGFSRPWNTNIGSVLGGKASRSYKVVKIDSENGEVKSVKDRDVTN